jgi:hypothetical protein
MFRHFYTKQFAGNFGSGSKVKERTVFGTDLKDVVMVEDQELIHRSHGHAGAEEKQIRPAETAPEG